MATIFGWTVLILAISGMGYAIWRAQTKKKKEIDYNQVPDKVRNPVKRSPLDK